MIGQRTDSTFSYVTITGVIRPFRSQSLDSPDVHLKTQLEITSHTQNVYKTLSEDQSQLAQ